MREKVIGIKDYFGIFLCLGVVTLWLFRIDDPLGLIFIGFVIATCRIPSAIKWSKIDIILIAICLYEWINWRIHGGVKIEVIYVPTLSLFAYIFLRSLLQVEKNRILFFKGLCIPIVISLFIGLVTFVLFIKSTYMAGFIDVYPFRFLFRPLGYITNVWVGIHFPLLGLLGIGYFIVRKYRWVFIFLWTLCSVSLFLSFSRGAYIAWIFYIACVFLIISNRKKKLFFLFICLFSHGLIFLFFPKEVKTTWSMNQTMSQQLSINSRIVTSQRSLVAVKKRLWNGAGSSNYALAMDKLLNQDSTHNYTSYAPNIIVLILVEKGIIGMLLYFLLFIAIVWECFRNRKHQIILLVGSTLVAVFIKELSFSSLFNSRASYLLVCILLVFMHDCTKNRELKVNKYSYVISSLGFSCMIILTAIGLLHQKIKKINQDAVSYLQQNEYRKAALSLEQLPPKAPFLINKAMLNIIAPETQLPTSFQNNAQFAIEEALILSPEDSFITLIQIELYIKNSQLGKAYFLLKKSVEEFPHNALYIYNFYALLSKLGKRSEALLQLKTAILLSPRLIHITNIRDIEDLKPSFMKEMIMNLAQTEDPNLLARYGYLAYYLNNKDLADKYLHKAISFQPSFSTPYFLLSKRSLEIGDVENAKIYLKKYYFLKNGTLVKYNFDIYNGDINLGYNLFWEEYSVKFHKWYDCLFLVQKK